MFPVTLETLFSLANVSVLPGWILLAAAPGWRWSQRYATLLVPLLLGPLYFWLIASNWGSGGFSTLSQVAELFRNPAVLLAGWIHYLIFDLFTGSWESRDALACGIPRWAVLPFLLLTFLLGPVGLAGYLALRAVWRRRFDPHEVSR